MKQKNDSSQGVTKTHLDKRFLSFEKIVDEKFVRFEVKFDLKLENLEREIDEKAKQYRDQILTSNDKLAKRLETIWEELEIGNFQMKDKIKNHEKRIKILESA